MPAVSCDPGKPSAVASHECTVSVSRREQVLSGFALGNRDDEQDLRASVGSSTCTGNYSDHYALYYSPRLPTFQTPFVFTKSSEVANKAARERDMQSQYWSKADS